LALTGSNVDCGSPGVGCETKLPFVDGPRFCGKRSKA